LAEEASTEHQALDGENRRNFIVSEIEDMCELRDTIYSISERLASFYT
jgi:hypothetical protein